ncbi:MAG: PAS domain-containing protein [Bacteroidia bacterium]|nr:PAS domain-containing protein [Bacteroidia bacterium]
MSLTALFKDFCHTHMASRATPLSEEYKKKMMDELLASPLRSVMQAWSVLDFYDYRHLWAEGFDTYFGYENSYISAETILEIVHPEDQEAFGMLYALCLEGLLNMPIPTKGIGHFCISYRMRDAKGNYRRITETNNIIECDPYTNIPLVNLAQITLMDTVQQDAPVSYYFSIKDERGVDIMRRRLEKYDRRVNIFTENEIKIARLLKQGLTSRQIAEKIFLSKHTVDKYRKNMLEKAQKVNTPQLLSYLGGLNLV